MRLCWTLLSNFVLFWYSEGLPDPSDLAIKAVLGEDQGEDQNRDAFVTVEENRVEGEQSVVHFQLE